MRKPELGSMCVSAHVLCDCVCVWLCDVTQWHTQLVHSFMHSTNAHHAPTVDQIYNPNLIICYLNVASKKKSTGAEGVRPEFKSWLCYTITVWPWAHHFLSLNLSFHIHKMGYYLIPARLSQGLQEAGTCQMVTAQHTEAIISLLFSWGPCFSHFNCEPNLNVHTFFLTSLWED